MADPPILAGLRQPFGEVSPLNRGVKVALHLAVVFVRAHVRAERRQLSSLDQIGFTGLQLQVKPVRRGNRALIYVIEGVATLGCPDEQRPPLPVRKRRADNLAPCLRGLVGELVQHNAVKVDAAHPVIIVSPVEPQPRPVMREVNAQLAFIDRSARYLSGVALHISPNHVLGLSIIRRDVSKSRVRLLAP